MAEMHVFEDVGVAKRIPVPGGYIYMVCEPYMGPDYRGEYHWRPVFVPAPAEVAAKLAAPEPAIDPRAWKRDGCTEPCGKVGRAGASAARCAFARNTVASRCPCACHPENAAPDAPGVRDIDLDEFVTCSEHAETGRWEVWAGGQLMDTFADAAPASDRAQEVRESFADALRDARMWSDVRRTKCDTFTCDEPARFCGDHTTGVQCGSVCRTKGCHKDARWCDACAPALCECRAERPDVKKDPHVSDEVGRFCCWPQDGTTWYFLERNESPKWVHATGPEKFTDDPILAWKCGWRLNAVNQARDLSRSWGVPLRQTEHVFVERAEVERLTAERDEALGITPTLARKQPCGCVVCYCEDQVQCQGCGAGVCDRHAAIGTLGNDPSAVWVRHPLLARAETAEASLAEMTKERDEAMRTRVPPPDHCPITGLALFMVIDDVPTYGGPRDSYTIPAPDADGCLVRRRYDHDEGCWRDDEDIGAQIVSEKDLNASAEREDAEKARADRLAAALEQTQVVLKGLHAGLSANTHTAHSIMCGTANDRPCAVVDQMSDNHAALAAGRAAKEPDHD